MFVRNRWCNPEHIPEKKTPCTLGIELLAEFQSMVLPSSARCEVITLETDLENLISTTAACLGSGIGSKSKLD